MEQVIQFKCITMHVILCLPVRFMGWKLPSTNEP